MDAWERLGARSNETREYGSYGSLSFFPMLLQA